MPFRFTEYDSPYTQQIASLMQAPGRAQAEALRANGQAEAQAALQSGQRSAQLANTVGGAVQSVAQIPQQIQQKKEQVTHLAFEQTQTAAAQLKLAEERKALVESDAFKAILKDTPMAAEDGLSLYDIPTLGKQLSAAGLDPTPYLGHLQQINAAFRAEQQAKTALVSVGAQKIIAAGNDPTLAHHFIDQLEANGSFSKETLQQYRDFIDADPANVAKLTSYLAGPQKIGVRPADSSLYNEMTGAGVGGPATPKPSELKDLPPTKEDAQRYLTQVDAIVPVTDKGNAGLRAATLSRITNARTNADAQRAIEDAQTQVGQINVAKNTAPIKISVAAGSQAAKDTAAAQGVTPESIEKAAVKYHETGEMSGMGMGNAVLRRQIMNKEAELYPNGSLAANSAAYKANSASLTKITSTLDNLSGFENAAGKNIQQFLTLAARLPDTGVPWVNTPIRVLNEKVVGAEWMPAIEAARKIALREVARVTNDPGLKGQLTDSARADVERMVGGDATIAQMKRTFPVLLQDMANVHNGLDEQKASIEQRLNIKRDTSSSATTPTPSAVPTYQDYLRSRQGQKH